MVVLVCLFIYASLKFYGSYPGESTCIDFQGDVDIAPGTSPGTVASLIKLQSLIIS